MTYSYEFLEHTADVKFKAKGSSLKEAFLASALALNSIIRGNIKILNTKEKKIKIKAKDKVGLLNRFLEEFLFLLDSQNFLVSSIKDLTINEEKLSLSATLKGDNAKNYKFTNDVKAITYNEMFIKKEKEEYICQVVLDV